MASRGFIAGPYVWSYNNRTIGVTQDGWNLNMSLFGQEITGDNLGDSMQDGVNRGANVTMEGQLNEWDVALNGVATDGAKTNTTCASIFWPWATLGQIGQVGKLLSLVAAPLVGTPAPNTTAATATVKNITMTYAVLPFNYNVSFLFAARLRSVPMRLQALPAPYLSDYFNDQNPVKWFALV